MERFSHRDQVLLGYSPHRSFPNPDSSPKIPSRNSDLDFHDVFGGPPRRSSIHEMRYSLGETSDSNASRGKEETLSSRGSWSGLSEKPVFGEDTLSRRRNTSDDFYNDIFRGDESLGSTPRKSDRDSFSSTPASRIMSPARSLPPKSEPFSGLSLPAQFSLPAKLTKGMDVSAFTSSCRNKDCVSSTIGSPSSPSVSVYRASNQMVQGQEESRNDVRPSYQQSPLSCELSLSSEVPSKATNSVKQDTGGNLKKDSSCSKVHINNSQFHFSIYKWASKGVPLAMPLRGRNSLSSKERGKSDRGSISNGRCEADSIVNELASPIMLGFESPVFNENASASNSSFKMECGNQDDYSSWNTMTPDRDDSSHFIEEAVPFINESKPQNSFQSTLTELSGNFVSHDARKESIVWSGVSGVPPGVSLCGDLEKETSVSMQEVRKIELKPLHSLYYDNNDGQGEDALDRQARVEEVKGVSSSAGKVDNGRNVRKRNGKRIISDPADATSASFEISPVKSEDKLVANRVKGKVKEFVKIFNQKLPSKAMANVEPRSQSSRWKDRGTTKEANEASGCATKANGKEHTLVASANETSTDNPIMLDELLKQSEESHNRISAGIHMIDGTSSEWCDWPAPNSESPPQNAEAAVGNVDKSPSEDLQGNYLIEELPLGKNKLPQSGGREYHDEIQISDARIRQWSNGKEGNIRSLLSTLQYIVWPESGWKPVPLIDIIEVNSVRRAYQKALLRLHPDKLQQKGAAPHQKYMAGKVFDLLQEAWTHFNSLG